MIKGSGSSRQRFSLRKGAAPVLAALLLAASIFALFTTVGAQIESQKLTELHFSGVKSCPEDIEQRRPARVVLQYIDGVFHKWEEYDLGKKGEFCIFLRKPEERRLSVGEAKTLLENSVRWREQGPPAGISEILDPADPRLQGQPVVPKLPDHTPILNVPASPEPDKPAPPAYPGRENRSGVNPERIPPPRPERVVGTDDRTRVTDVDPYNTESYAWNTVGYVCNDYPSYRSYRGSGAIVGPYMVLTAGHMVYDWSTEGGYASAVCFAPGQRQMSPGGAVERPYGELTASSWQTNSNYIDALKTNPAAQFDYDYAAVFFNTSFASMGLNTYMPVVFDYNPAINDAINLAGYPASVQGETNSQGMWRSSGNVTAIADRVIYYNADTTGGNSGGPVGELVIPGQRRIIAVHGVSTPGACRMVSQNQEIIESWMCWPSGCKKEEDERGCFIATAAFGSYLDPHVQVLRDFRGRYLLTNGPGREFVRFYSQFSPPMSDFIKDHEILRTATRVLLTPVVYAVKYPLGLLGVCGLAVIVGGGVYRTRRQISSL